MEGKGQIDPKTWKGIRSVMQVQLMVAFVVAVLLLAPQRRAPHPDADRPL